MEISNENSLECTFKNYYYGNVSDNETEVSKPLKIRTQKRTNNIDVFFEKPTMKQAAEYSSTVAQLTNGGTNYISSRVDDVSKATHLIKIDVYDMKKLRGVPSDQHWKFANTRIKYYTQTEEDDYYSNTQELIYNITKHIATKNNCKKYFIEAKP
ncbi:uncharacterized protein LOC134650639 [Cydia amplana]|uniref:uncharacterized protein LOC134650639 n=1 Tax=Cydia amplana TaxID=1869771 RepID=UPI002FE5786E